jgi:hypothetical protein
MKWNNNEFFSICDNLPCSKRVKWLYLSLHIIYLHLFELIWMGYDLLRELYFFYISTQVLLLKDQALEFLALQCIFLVLQAYYFDEHLVNHFRIIPIYLIATIVLSSFSIT